MTNRKLNMLVFVAFVLGAWLAWWLKPSRVETVDTMDGVFARANAANREREAAHRASLSLEDRLDYDLRQARIRQDVREWLSEEGYNDAT